ncbi:TPA: hypothetical protein DCG61_01385 [Patescibacteria group bacterium]|nr:hypothetical protein [Patescibacteria group bacterium]
MDRQQKKCIKTAPIDYSFQLSAAQKIAADCENSKFVGAALMAAVGSGKTVMLTHALNLIAKKNPDAKILFLAHGQNVLKNQTLDYFGDLSSPVKPEFTFGIFNSGAQVEVAIPQEVKPSPSNLKFTHIVVDEAHEWLSSSSVINGIIQRLSKPKLIVATGSVSLFNRYNKKFPDRPFAVTYISGEEMIRRGVYSAVTLDLIRVTSASDTNSILNRFFDKAKNDQRALEMPIVICESIVQANRVSGYLQMKNYLVALSTSENDNNSEVILKFKNGERNALVLVNRGVLGMNLPSASCALYLKKTKNIEIIQQALARIYRRHPDDITKYFYMPSSTDEWNQKVRLLQEVLSLNKLEVMRSYCG